MIAKISATENLGGALGYNFKKVEKGDAEVILSKGLYQPAEGEFKMEEVLRDMQALIPTHCRTKKIVFHCSLNPHPDERLSDERLATLAEEYMQALGYGSQPYIVFKHHDIEREHIHIVSLRVNPNRSLDRYCADRYEEDNFLSAFIFLLSSCFSSLLDVATTPKANDKPSAQQLNEMV